jgi:regulator of protease activity HflC (stomatin/prohibitin superfamily)
MTMTARTINPHAAMFLVKDWYDALVGRVLPRVREYISEHKYEDIIRNKDIQLDADVFRALNQADPNGGQSIVSILRDQYGILLVALETINIDPPPEYRETTLKEYLAKQRVKVAKQNKVVEAEETSGALELMVDRQIKMMKNKKGASLTLTKEDTLKIRQECLNILLRERALKAGALKEVRLANADGTSFGSGSIAEIAGGIAAAILAKTSFGSGSDDGKKKGGKRKDPKDMDPDELEEEWEKDQQEG